MIKISIYWTSEYDRVNTHFGNMRVTIHKRRGQLVSRYKVRNGLLSKVADYNLDGMCLRNKGFNLEQLQFIEEYSKRHKSDIIEMVEGGFVKTSAIYR